MPIERIILVTGATDGIGRQTALTLARRGARVLVHGRTRAKAEAAAGAIRELARSDRAEPVWGDLSSLAEVRALALDVGGRVPRLDVLLNNAGVFLNERTVTRDGLEATFQVNHLAPFLLTHLLLDKLHESDEPRVVNVSSIAHARGRTRRSASDPCRDRRTDPRTGSRRPGTCSRPACSSIRRCTGDRSRRSARCWISCRRRSRRTARDRRRTGPARTSLRSRPRRRRRGGCTRRSASRRAPDPRTTPRSASDHRRRRRTPRSTRRRRCTRRRSPRSARWTSRDRGSRDRSSWSEARR